MNKLRETIYPGLRGAFFYAAYWGVVGTFEPFITVHFMRLGFTDQQIGWLAAVFPLFNFIITPLITRLADRTNRRIILLTIAAAGLGLSTIVLPLPTTFWAVLPIFAIVMAFRSPVVPLADSLIAKMAERHQLDFGSMRLWGSLIFTATSMTLGFIWQRTGFQTMFVTAGILFALVILAAQLLEEASPNQPNPHQAAAGATQSSRFHLPEAGIICLLAANFLLIGAFFMSATFGTVYMNSIGGTEMHIGALFGISALAEVPGMMFGKRIARRLGETSTLLAAYALVVVAFAGFAISATPLVMLAFAVVRGLGFGIFIVTAVTILNHRAPHNMYATYQGLQNALCWGLAPLLGGPIAGYLYQTYNAATLFNINAIMVVVAGIILLPTYRLWRAHPTETAVTPARESL